MQFTFSAQESVLKEALDEIARKIAEAEQAAVKEAADLAVEKGQANIASAGFSGRWQRAFTSRFYPNKGINPAALIFHAIPLASVFETGITIQGRPLLWLPLHPGLPSPSAYGRRLVSVNIAGKPPLLFDADNRQRGPLYFGTSAVTIEKKFNLLAIIANAAERMREFYERNLRV